MLTATAHAKLNLYLHIQGKRADGYHLLESLVVFTEFGDQIAVEKSDVLSLHIDGAFASSVGEVEQNLVMRAARALQTTCSVTEGACITLTKHIPVGAGLGGGSSDAAAMLKLLCKFWAVIPSNEQIHRIAVSLGADVPMCLESKPLIARGIGDELSLLNKAMAPFPIVLVYPRVHLATAEVYARYQHERTIESPFINAVDVVRSLSVSRNQLQRAAIALAPEVAEVLLVLEGYPQAQLVRMCGSGSSCFAIAQDEVAAQSMVNDIMQRYPQWWVKVTKTL